MDADTAMLSDTNDFNLTAKLEHIQWVRSTSAKSKV